MRFFEENFGAYWEFNSGREYLKFKLGIILGGILGKIIFYGFLFGLFYWLAKS